MEFYELSTITNIIHKRCLYLPLLEVLGQKPSLLGLAWHNLSQRIFQALNNGGWPNGEDEDDQASSKITCKLQILTLNGEEMEEKEEGGCLGFAKMGKEPIS